MPGILTKKGKQVHKKDEYKGITQAYRDKI